MAVDLMCVFPQDSIRLSDIRSVNLGGVRGLRIVGDDFRAVDEVLINNMESPDVIVVNKNELIAQLPDSLQVAPDINAVVVLSRNLTVTKRSVLQFRIGKRPGKVKGIQRLLQLFVKILFTTPGSDIFNPSAGGGVMNKVGSTFGEAESKDIASEFVIAVQRVQRQIVAMQSRDQRSPRSERLLSATVVGSKFDKLQGAFYVSVEVISQAGVAGTANVEI